MLNGFGIFAGAVGVVMALWFIHIGFVLKDILKQQKETNRILQQLAAGSSAASTTKAAAA
jgi:predicted anti-sigma-YlaC factor YlaD